MKVMKPLKAFRVGEPIPAINKTIIVPEADTLLTEPAIMKILKESRECYASKSAQKLKRAAGRTPVLPRSSYRTTHDHVARTTTLIQRVEDTEIKRFPAVPGILSLRQALLANGVFSPKHPLFRS